MRTEGSYLEEYRILTKEIRALKRKLNKNLHYEEVLNIQASIIQKRCRKERVSQILADAFGMFQG